MNLNTNQKPHLQKLPRMKLRKHNYREDKCQVLLDRLMTMTVPTKITYLVLSTESIFLGQAKRKCGSMYKILQMMSQNMFLLTKKEICMRCLFGWKVSYILYLH